jgi:putative FmdB family regulatory protein
MPLFEYHCRDCGHVFEVFTQRREPLAALKCPNCGKMKVERVLSAFSGTTSKGSCGPASSGFG